MSDTPRTDIAAFRQNDGTARYDTRTGAPLKIVTANFARDLERELAEAIALLRELNDALAIPERFQPRVDAVLDRAEAGPSASENDAARWREHVEIMKAATMPGALLMRFMMNAHGKQWGIEYVIDTEQLGHNTLGVKAVGLAAEQKAVELFAAINESQPQGETK